MIQLSLTIEANKFICEFELKTRFISFWSPDLLCVKQCAVMLVEGYKLILLFTTARVLARGCG